VVNNVRDLITLHEGRVPHAYQDSLGYWTIGVGHLIDKRRGGELPAHIIDALLDYDIKAHSAALEAEQPWVKDLDEVRRAVMYDMTFNLGIEPFDDDDFKDWDNFVAQVRTGRYAAAAANMRTTLWAKQVGPRAMRLAKMMETGQWES